MPNKCMTVDCKKKKKNSLLQCLVQEDDNDQEGLASGCDVMTLRVINCINKTGYREEWLSGRQRTISNCSSNILILLLKNIDFCFCKICTKKYKN